MRPSLHPTINDPSHSDLQAWKTVFDTEGVPHVIPRYGPRHVISMRCWCHPVRDEDYEEPAISHNVAQ